MGMRDWITKLDEFLRISDRDLLTRAGAVSHDDAMSTALTEFEKYRAIEDRKPKLVDLRFEEAVQLTKKLGKAPKKAGHSS